MRKLPADLPDDVVNRAVLTQRAHFDEAQLAGLIDQRLNVSERAEDDAIVRAAGLVDDARNPVLTPGNLQSVADNLELMRVFARRVRATVRNGLRGCAGSQLNNR